MSNIAAAHEAPTTNLALLVAPQAPSLSSHQAAMIADYDGPGRERKAWHDAIESALPGATIDGGLLIVWDLTHRSLQPELTDHWFVNLAPSLVKMFACQVVTAVCVPSYALKSIPDDLAGVRFELTGFSHNLNELSLHLRKPKIEGAEPRKLAASWMRRAIVVRDAAPAPIIGQSRPQPEPEPEPVITQ
jgi:hypothetical protein